VECLLTRFAEKMNRDLDNLTPLDAHNSLLMDNAPFRSDEQEVNRFNQTGPYEPYRHRVAPKRGHESTDQLISYEPSHYHHRSLSGDRAPSPDDYHGDHPYGVAY
jgi:hypothetical protein